MGILDAPGYTRAQADARYIPQRIYSDAPYTPGSDLAPFNTDKGKISAWGSSTAEGLRFELADLAPRLGATFYNGGKGGEYADTINARLGASPARLTFPSNTIPASGAATVTSSNIVPNSSNLTYTGTIGGVAGSLASNAGSIIFTRTTPGSAVTVPADSEFTPTVGNQYKGSVLIINMGKNDLDGTNASGDKVIAAINKAFDWHAAFVKRILILGHFSDTGRAPGDAERVQIQRVNAALAARYGSLYIDTYAMVTDPGLWVELGLTSTGTDATEQANGNLPPTIALDVQHLNFAGRYLLRKRISARMISLGWYTAEGQGALVASDNFDRADGALGTSSSGHTWEAPVGVQVVSGKAALAGGAVGGAAAINTGKTDGTVRATAGAIWVGLAFRMTASPAGSWAGYVFAYNNSLATYRLAAKDTAGTYTELATFPAKVRTTGDVLSVRMIGTQITCLVNGVPIIQVTNSTYTGTRHGVWFLSSTTGTADDFEFRDLPAV